jgi:hypothetical protein
MSIGRRLALEVGRWWAGGERAPAEEGAGEEPDVKILEPAVKTAIAGIRLEFPTPSGNTPPPFIIGSSAPNL